MDSADEQRLSDECIVHRIGGNALENFRLKKSEQQLKPPGISVLLGGTPQQAAQQILSKFPDARKFRVLHQLAQRVGTATVGDIRNSGFDVIANATPNFANHGRIVHPDGVAGFDDDRVLELGQVFAEVVL